MKDDSKMTQERLLDLRIPILAVSTHSIFGIELPTWREENSNDD
jgi:hypothetical protein